MARVRGVIARTAAAASMRAAERIAVCTVLGMTVRVGVRSVVPAAIAAEAAALGAEWRAHQAGLSAAESRRRGERAGLATSDAAFALAAIPAGPAGVIGGAFAGVAVWAGGAAVTAAAA